MADLFTVTAPLLVRHADRVCVLSADHADSVSYLRALRRTLPKAMDRFKPGLVIYLAGADVCRGDLLGGLALSPADLRRRETFVAGLCRDRNIPLAVTLGGGYRKAAAGAARLHAGSIKTVLKAYK